MFEYLLYAEISCSNASEMMDRIRDHQALSDIVKTELLEVIQEVAPPGCSWDAND